LVENFTIKHGRICLGFNLTSAGWTRAIREFSDAIHTIKSMTTTEYEVITLLFKANP
jgi:hypothetical protein